MDDYLITSTDKAIDFYFPYSRDWNMEVRKLPGVRWLHKTKRWRVNKSPWIARKILEQFPEEIWEIVDDIRDLADIRPRLEEEIEHDPRLYEFQKTAVEFGLAREGRLILGDEMGLGKTVEALSIANHLNLSKILVVCPSVVKYKWEDEIKTWTNLEQTQIVETGKDDFDPDAQVMIFSYTMMNIRSDELLEIPFDGIIFDEAHYLKSSPNKVQRVRSAQDLIHDDMALMFLTGTPILNRPIELYNMLHWLNPVEWSSRYKFGTRYCGGYGQEFKGATNRKELADRLDFYMVRRLKADVLEDLPPIQRSKIPLHIRDIEQYMKLEQATYDEIRSLDLTKSSAYMRAFDLLAKLRSAIGVVKASYVAEVAKSFLDERDKNTKLVIYCHHHKVVDKLRKELKDYGVAEITGQVSKKQRFEQQKRYQGRNGPRCMLISTAGGLGIDLFGTEGVDSSTILFAERQWSPAVEEQGEGRLHRIGQEEKVLAYYPVITGTLDDTMDRSIDKKRKIMKDIVNLDEVETSIVPDLLEAISGQTRSNQYNVS